MRGTTHTDGIPHTYEQALGRAARLWGIEPDYGDTWGKLHITAPETQKAILTALGVDTTSRESLERAVENRIFQDWDRLVPPVVVAGAATWASGFPLHVPASMADGSAVVEFRWENGQTERQTFQLSELVNNGRADVRGTSYTRKRVPLPVSATLGYHDVTVTLHGSHGETRQASTRLILCPDRAYVPPALRNGGKTAGITLALFSLRSNRNWGCGDYTDLEGAVDWVSSEVGAGFIGLNPLHAIPNRQPFNTSPYLPTSTFYKNPLYLDVERIPDFQNARRARRFLRTPATAREIAELRATGLVEYERVWALKLFALKLAFAWFLRHEHRCDTDRAREFQEYAKREGGLLDGYAVFSALDDFLHRQIPDAWIWPDWPEQYRDPESEAVRTFARKRWRLVLFYKYVQWQSALQLERAQEYARFRGLSIGLFHDLALAVDRYGADLWAYGRFYVRGCRVGAPPDGFSPKGQDWSFPPPDSERHRHDGYRLFAESVRKNCQHGGALRMDHVMRFFRLYWIPEYMQPDQGAYVRDRFDELLHIVALESVREKVVLVGEDLGTVTTEIRQALNRFGIHGYKVLFFEKSDRGDLRLPYQYAAQAVVASSTHDLPTLAGFWLARDIEARRDAGLLRDNSAFPKMLAERQREKQKLLDALFAEGLLPEWTPRRAEQIPEFTGELHNAMIGWLAEAGSRLLAVNQEDLLKETEQQNLPATTSEYPNWRRKMSFTIEQLRDGAARDYTAMLRAWLVKTGRLAGTSQGHVGA